MDSAFEQVGNLDAIIASIKEDYQRRGYGAIVSLNRNPSKKQVIQLIIDATKFLDEQAPAPSTKYSLQERLWFLFNGKKEFPCCSNEDCKKVLNDPKNFLNLKLGFRQYCSLKCACSSDLRTQHIQQTTLERTGYTSVFQSPEVIEQIKQTNASKSDEEKQAKVDKARKTRYQKNDGKWHADDFPAKCKETLEDRHGDPNWHNVELTKKTMNDNYGVSCSFNIPDVEKKSATAIQRKSFDKFILGSPFDKPLFSFEEYCENHDLQHEFEFQCLKCGTVFKSVHRDGHHARCPKCYPKEHGVSIEEKEFKDFIASIVGEDDLVLNSRKVAPPYEIDVFCKEEKLAFEFDGLFWHCEYNKSDPMYHSKKTETCKAKGIQLIHVFEDEWICKKDIVKANVRQMLSASERSVDANMCEVREVCLSEAMKFLDSNCIYGATEADVALGLFAGTELVQLMTFRGKHGDEWSLLCCCSKNGCDVLNGAQKLLMHFEKRWHPCSIVSVVDRRWEDGKLQRSLGFELEATNKPDYWYVTGVGIREPKAKFKKSKLESLLKKFDPAKSVVQNMVDNNFFRIFDCGTCMFVKRCKQA